MPKSKLVFVKDSVAGYEYKFLVTKFEEEDTEILKRSGWALSDELTCIVRLGHKPELAMAEFDHPPSDLHERGGMSVNRTTIAIATLFRNTSFDKIPSEIDLGDMPVRSVKERKN